MEEHERYMNPVFQDEAKLEQAISRVEAQRKSIFDLWFFWLCGLLGVGFGIFAYHRINRWLGMAGMITGFAEMTTWTSALWRTLGPQGEFERLLTTKLILSVVTLALLIVIWLKSERTESVSRPA